MGSLPQGRPELVQDRREPPMSPLGVSEAGQSRDLLERKLALKAQPYHQPFVRLERLDRSPQGHPLLGVENPGLGARRLISGVDRLRLAVRSDRL